MIQRRDIDGILLFDKHSGTNFLFDEVYVDQPCLAPRHVSIALTTSCNFACVHCYIIHDNKQLYLSRVKEWVDVLCKNGCLSIGLGGGEPTIWKDIVELCKHIGSTEMALTLTTNGSADVSFYRELMQYVNLLRFSIDGLSDVYESYRKQSYINTIGKIAKLREANAKIGINYLLTDKTVEQLDMFLQLIYDMQPSEILLIPCLTKMGEETLSWQAKKRVKNWVAKNQGRIPLAFSYSSINMVSNFALPIQDFTPQKQKHYFLHINAYGNIMKSVFDDKPIRIGNSLTNALKKIKGD
jgi:Predicted Fe-S oxidoreductases